MYSKITPVYGQVYGCRVLVDEAEVGGGNGLGEERECFWEVSAGPNLIF